MIPDSLRNLRDQGIFTAGDAGIIISSHLAPFARFAKNLSTIIEPLIVVFFGIIIGVVVGAAYLPIFSASDAVFSASMLDSNRQTNL